MSYATTVQSFPDGSRLQDGVRPAEAIEAPEAVPGRAGRWVLIGWADVDLKHNSPQNMDTRSRIRFFWQWRE